MIGKPQAPIHSLWRQALSRPIHNPSCGCAVPAGVRLDPVTMELDLCDFVEEKYDLARYPLWLDARVSRESDRVGSFPDWLESLQPDTLAGAVHARVMEATLVVLRGMAEHASARLAPVGAFSAGWLSGAADSGATD